MLLSILIPGKNDDYFNATLKLSLNLKKIISNIKALGVDDVEVVLCDWGSEVKITDYLNLQTDNNFKCAYVAPEIATKYNRGGNYVIPQPINTAFKRSRGNYVIFWDSDCYVRYEDFINLYNFVKQIDSNNDMSFYWGSRYHIPHELYCNANSYLDLDKNLSEINISSLPHDKINSSDFGGRAISILMNRQLWEDSTGWWEELVHWGWQDIEFHKRLCQKYSFSGDLEDRGINFFHLNHHSVNVLELLKTRKNSDPINANDFKANGDAWGLTNENVLLY
jgi:predicted glycosyltransferase involved in capsule biosynthesis